MEVFNFMPRAQMIYCNFCFYKKLHESITFGHPNCSWQDDTMSEITKPSKTKSLLNENFLRLYHGQQFLLSSFQTPSPSLSHWISRLSWVRYYDKVIHIASISYHHWWRSSTMAISEMNRVLHSFCLLVIVMIWNGDLIIERYSNPTFHLLFKSFS